MADISKLKVDNTTYDIKDASARQEIHPIPITKAAYDQLTQQEKEAHRYIITDFPDGDIIDLSTETVTGNPLSFTTDSEQAARSCVITFEPIQAGSGDPSPTNVREISGHNKVELAVPKKNLLNCNCKTSIPSDTALTNTTPRKFESDTVVYGLAKNNYYDVTKVSNVVRTANSVSGTSFSTYGVGFVKLLSQATTYTLSFTAASGTNVSIAEYKKDGTYVKNIVNVTSPYQYNTSTQEERVSIIVIDGNGGDFSVSNLQLELGSTATTYEPYTPITDISQSLPETIYGGTLDVESGELVVDRGIVDLGTLGWHYNSTSNVFYSDAIDNKKNDIAAMVCEIFKLTDVSVSSMPNYSIRGNSSSAIVYVKDTDYTNANDFTTAVTGKKLVYELATPYTLHLTPHQVRLLLGSNVVTTNGTSIALTYRNGEVASLADVSSVAESVNALGEYVDSKPAVLIASSSYDGFKTLAQQYDELIDNIKNSLSTNQILNSFMRRGYTILYPSFITSTAFQYTYTSVGNSVTIRTYYKNNTTTNVKECIINASSVTVTDKSDDVATANLDLFIR